MKKKMALLLVTVVMTAAMLTGCGKSGNRNSDEVGTEETREPSGMVHLDGVDDVSAFFDEAYEGVAEDLLPYEVTTTELDMNDADTISYHTGLTDLSSIEGIYLSESMMTSTAYSAVYIRTNDEIDEAKVKEIRQQLMDNIDPSKWICVTAEKQIAAVFGKDIFFVMGAADTADEVYSSAKAAAESRNMSVSDTLEKNNPI